MDTIQTTPKMMVNITSCLIKRLNLIAEPKMYFSMDTHTRSASQADENEISVSNKPLFADLILSLFLHLTHS